MFNLNQSHLRVVTRLDNVYTYDIEVSKCENCKYPSYHLLGGYTANILNELSHYLNFSFEILPDPSLTYRFDLAPKFSVDLFAASYSLQRLNASVVVPTFVTGASRIQIFLNRHFESSKNDVVFLPFDQTVWILLLLLVLFATICSAGVTRVTESAPTQDGVFLIFAIACLKGCGVNVQSLSSRIIVWTMSITFVVIFAAYSGSIVSINAVKKYSINSFEKVLSSHFDVGFDVGFNNGSVIQRATDEILNGSSSIQQMYKKMIKSVFRFDTFEESFVRVSKSPFSYIIDKETGYTAMEEAFGYVPCEIASISFRGISYPWGMFVVKGSKYRPAINFGIQRLRETGQLRYFMRKWIPGVDNEACSSRNIEDTSVRMGQLQSAFLINTAGTILAFIIFVAEKIIKWKSEKLNAKKPELAHSNAMVRQNIPGIYSSHNNKRNAR